MSFLEDKKKQLEREDKSNEGKWDLRIKDLCLKINKNKEYYTTSSCAGRVILVKSGGKSRDAFLFKSHEKISFARLKKELDGLEYNKLVYFKLDSCILHVACSSLESGELLLVKAKESGWKRSGMMTSGKRIVLELLSTEKLEFPIMNNNKILVDDEFLKLIVKEANDKLDKVDEKIARLEKLI